MIYDGLFNKVNNSLSTSWLLNISVTLLCSVKL